MGKISRRELLKGLGIGSLALVGGHIVKSPLSPTQLAYASDDVKWKQFKGSKLVFMSEDTPPTSAIKSKIKSFKDLTGMDIEIIQEHLDIVSEKVGIDVRGKKGAYPVYYSQDKPIGAPFHAHAEDLRKYEADPTFPKVTDGVGSDVWLYRFLDVTGRFYGEPKIAAYPYDNAICVMMYRKDLFEKYSKQFESEYKKPLRYTENTTWKDVLDISKFFKKANFPDVKYGLALQGREGWGGQLDFQRVCYAHGQWREWDFDDWTGSRKPGPCKWGDEQSIVCLEKYKELMQYSHPDSLTNDWSGANTAYITGLAAMVPNYGEFAAVVEDPKQSVAAGGRTAYELCPKGDPSWIVNRGKAVNATNYGIGGIAINSYSKPELKKAAYLFVLWATSYETMMMVLKDVGGTPDRKRVFEDPEVKKAFVRETAPMKNIEPVEMEKGNPASRVTKVPLMPNGLTYGPSLKGILPPNVVVGPKIPKFNEYIQILTSEVQKCVSGAKTAKEACLAIKEKTDKLHGVK
ncbi:MAG: extracellular solute-binding protein [Deltaproteobacteria bacterium]|nr:extracellular solute-binding protein [Deltaproteobacteria bacterium]